MLRRIAGWMLAVLIGAAVGLGSAWAALSIGRANFVERYGAWTHSRAAGSPAAGPYTRAIIAREGLLALSAREALYFTLVADETGRPLEEGCIYELRGREPAARWWSITLYAGDNFLAQNTDHAHSIDASEVSAGEDGSWRARVSPVKGDAAHWISSRAARRGFSLMLRVYNPQQGFRASADTLPQLTVLSCAGAS